jgi:hypothetical protein
VLSIPLCGAVEEAGRALAVAPGGGGGRGGDREHGVLAWRQRRAAEVPDGRERPLQRCARPGRLAAHRRPAVLGQADRDARRVVTRSKRARSPIAAARSIALPTRADLKREL